MVPITEHSGVVESPPQPPIWESDPVGSHAPKIAFRSPCALLQDGSSLKGGEHLHVHSRNECVVMRVMPPHI